MKDIDIVDIKTAVKESCIWFYVKGSTIYASNPIGEVVKVGELKKEDY